MARSPNLDKFSYAKLLELRQELDALLISKKSEEKDALKAQLSEMAKESGFSLDEVFGRGRPKGSKVAIKYRDPKNPENTWTGRGRMPRWMVAATKTRGVKKDDFLV